MAQAPVLTITLNPALDVTTSAPRVVPDAKLRCTPPRVDPGGGGINVSRAIRAMGGDSTALVALGGATGQRIAELLAETGVAVRSLPAPGETRQSVTVDDQALRQQFRFVMPGPQWSGADVEAALQAAADAAAGALVVLSGSNPPGVPAGFAARLAERLQGSGARLVVDTSGEALAMAAAVVDRRVEILRMDDAEAEGLAGHPLPYRADTARFAAGLVASGAARAVIVARGRDGNIIATGEGIWHAEAARVPIVSKVGAGDSFLAGFVLGYARGWPIPDALGLAAAAASATVQTPATELCRAEDVERLFAARVVSEMRL
ncbi:6-phosphofructokinase 2 [Paracoccus aminovorans]|uniref:Phosphofructokinase n=1 Tax=Paracoccus aminovorans TaxID=34004 RepID=A0A1I3BMI7_9RHOB|nr:1-phosphofructokinase family hexose kinase [Paracoccus aminovorans]CQR86859.1 sugar kinase [Paracoccus aminovorans]SFH63390.1 6-phosphofructokinase 2 [Paracoccus aminovorans]